MGSKAPKFMFFLTRQCSRGGKGKRGGVVVGSKEIRSLGRDSKRVVMPRREGYCGYTASSCTRLPGCGEVEAGAGRATTHDWWSRCTLSTKWEGEVLGLRP